MRYRSSLPPRSFSSSTRPAIEPGRACGSIRNGFLGSRSIADGRFRRQLRLRHQLINIIHIQEKLGEHCGFSAAGELLENPPVS